MNKRQAKKNFRKHVHVFPIGRFSKAGIPLKKLVRKEYFEELKRQKRDYDMFFKPLDNLFM